MGLPTPTPTVTPSVTPTVAPSPVVSPVATNTQDDPTTATFTEEKEPTPTPTPTPTVSPAPETVTDVQTYTIDIKYYFADQNEYCAWVVQKNNISGGMTRGECNGDYAIYTSNIPAMTAPTFSLEVTTNVTGNDFSMSCRILFNGKITVADELKIDGESDCAFSVATLLGVPYKMHATVEDQWVGNWEYIYINRRDFYLVGDNTLTSSL
jgi:hypothetical protein